MPPQGRLPSRGLVPLSPALTRCCPSQRKQPHPAGWILSWTGRLRKEERRRKKGRKRPSSAELRLQCTVLARRGQQTQNLGPIAVLRGGLPAQFKNSSICYLSSPHSSLIVNIAYVRKSVHRISWDHVFSSAFLTWKFLGPHLVIIQKSQMSLDQLSSHNLAISGVTT